MIAKFEPSQLELDFSTRASSPLASTPKEELARLQREYDAFRREHFEFHASVSADIRALYSENLQLKSLGLARASTSDGKTKITPEEGCAHQRMHAGLDSAYCPDCRKSLKTWSKEYKSLLEGKIERPPERPPEGPPEDGHRHITASGWVERYLVKRRWEYYRYCWQLGHRGKINKLHIPKDSGKLTAVREAIAQRRTPQEIEQLIKFWKGERHDQAKNH